jgi:signal transduction histidine kinase
VGSPIELLEAAAGRVRDRIDEMCPPLVPGGTARAEALLQTLQSEVVQVIRGEDPKPILERLGSDPLYEPLLDAMGRELIDGARVESSVATLAALRALVSMRAVRVAATQPIDSDSEDLSAHMRRPDAFELLVEMAHDFRSPLTSILFLSEALRNGHSGPLTDIQRSQLGLVYSAAFGLASIASDVMDLARKENDLMGDEAEPFSIAELFQSVERMVQPIVEEKDLEFRAIAPERWQSVGHPRALRRILLNLTTNALKFTDQGRVEIGVRAIPHGQLEYYVLDTGRGMTPEEQRNVFKPFRRRSRSPSGSHYFSGSGVGLSIARRLLQAMGSDLQLDSMIGEGTRFSFVLSPNEGASSQA